MKAIVATNSQNVIGADNTIPWRCKPDMQWFKKCTTNHIVVMGSQTFVSIGKPLPNRYNVVLTSKTDKLFQYHTRETDSTVLVLLNPKYTNRDLHCVLNELGKNTGKYVWVCGGAQVYRQLVRFCDTVFISRIPDHYCIPASGTLSIFDPCTETHILTGMHATEDVSVETWAHKGIVANPVNIDDQADLHRLQYAL